MEHHFFTDTVTETEINTEVVGAYLPKIDELQTFLSSKGIELEVLLNSDGIAGTDDWEEGEGFQGKGTMHVLSSMVEQNGAYYIESVLTTKYLYKRN